MRIRFTIVPLPMTAAEKFNEAVYFYNQMIATVNNTRTFPFNVSAFLSALRSTTFYLQAQYKHDERFAEWYEKAQKTMKSDLVLEMLNELRREAIHQKPVNLLVNSGPKFHENPITVTEVFEATSGTDNEGNIFWLYKNGHEGVERTADALTDWEFEKNEKSVIEACKHGLDQMGGLLREWNQLFGKAWDDRQVNL